MKMSKRQLIICACDGCRHAKMKCDGERPECVRCRQKGKPCSFATRPGQTRQQALQDTNTDQLEQLSQYKRIFAMLLHDQNAPKLLEELRANATTTPDYIAMQTLLDERPELSPTEALETYSTDQSPEPYLPFNPSESYIIQPQYRMRPLPQQQQADEKRPTTARFTPAMPSTYPFLTAPATCTLLPGSTIFGPLPAPDYQLAFNGDMNLLGTQTDGTFTGVALPDIEGQDDFLMDIPMIPYSESPPAYPGCYAPT